MQRQALTARRAGVQVRVMHTQEEQRRNVISLQYSIASAVGGAADSAACAAGYGEAATAGLLSLFGGLSL